MVTPVRGRFKETLSQCALARRFIIESHTNGPPTPFVPLSDLFIFTPLLSEVKWRIDQKNPHPRSAQKRRGTGP